MDAAVDVSEGAQILISITTTIGLVLVAGLGFLGILAGITRGHAKTARVASVAALDQVANTHTENFRDDMDSKFGRLESRLDQIIDSVIDTNQRIGRVEKWRETHEDATPKTSNK